MSFVSEDKRLWAAVLLQALKDATSQPDTILSQHAVDEARQWFIDANKNYELVCLLAEQCPIRTRVAALKRIAEATAQPKVPKKSPRTKYYEHNGRSLRLREWASVTGFSEKTISQRLRFGWTLEQALTLPLRTKVFPYDRGVASNLPKKAGDRRGSAAQDFSKIEFFQKEGEQ